MGGWDSVAVEIMSSSEGGHGFREPVEDMGEGRVLLAAALALAVSMLRWFVLWECLEAIAFCSVVLLLLLLLLDAGIGCRMQNMKVLRNSGGRKKRWRWVVLEIQIDVWCGLEVEVGMLDAMVENRRANKIGLGRT